LGEAHRHQNTMTNNRRASAELLKEFLLRPLVKRTQLGFVKLCVGLIAKNIRYRLNRGWKIHFDQKDTNAGINDLAIDIAGSLLGHHKGEPYGEVFEFFRTRGVLEISQSDPIHLLDLLEGLIGRHTQQELSGHIGDVDPQSNNLRRRFKDILTGEEYQELRVPSDLVICVARSTPDADLRLDMPLVTHQQHVEIVEESFVKFGDTRVNWCRAIFDCLDHESEHCNCLRKYELLNTVVAVNMRHVDLNSVPQTWIPSPKSGLLWEAAEKARRETLLWVSENGLRTFIQKGRISSEVADCFLEATDLCLIDLIWSTKTAKLPVYFREAMPVEEHGRYLEHYKHIFQTTLNTAEAYFKDLMRDFYKSDW